MPELDGSCAQGTFGCAGLLDPRSANLRTAASLSFSSKRDGAPNVDLANEKALSQPARRRSGLPARKP